MKVVAITQARTGSTRFPKKILKKICNQTLLEIHLNRIKKSKIINKIIVATTHKKDDDKVVELAKLSSVSFFRGSENDVLDRFYQSVKQLKPDFIIRLTSDCPLIDAELIDKMILYMQNCNADYISNTLKQEYPDGQDIEIFTFTVLESAWKNAKLKSDREHVTPYIIKNGTFSGGNLYKTKNYKSPKNYNQVRMTVDEEADYLTILEIVNTLGLNKSWLGYTNFVLDNPSIVQNHQIKRNEGYLKSLKNN